MKSPLKPSPGPDVFINKGFSPTLSKLAIAIICILGSGLIGLIWWGLITKLLGG
jgi:hypothetical protein